jgi:hypothetical protein
MKPTHDELAAQMAAFLASGGSVETVETVEDPKLAEAHFHNATDKIVARKMRRGGNPRHRGRAALLRSSRGDYQLS